MAVGKSKEKKPLVKMTKKRPIIIAFYKWQQHLALLTPSLQLVLSQNIYIYIDR